MHLSAWILSAIYFSPCVEAFYPYKAEEKTGSVTKGDDKTARRSLLENLLAGRGLNPRKDNVDVPTLNIRRRAPRVGSIRWPSKSFCELNPSRITPTPISITFVSSTTYLQSTKPGARRNVAPTLPQKVERENSWRLEERPLSARMDTRS